MSNVINIVNNRAAAGREAADAPLAVIKRLKRLDQDLCHAGLISVAGTDCGNKVCGLAS